jgi:hypothetical protein
LLVEVTLWLRTFSSKVKFCFAKTADSRFIFTSFGSSYTEDCREKAVGIISIYTTPVSFANSPSYVAAATVVFGMSGGLPKLRPFVFIS